MKAEGFEEYRRFEVNGEIVGRRRMEGWVSAREVMWGKIHSHGEWKTKNDTSFFLGFEFKELRFWHCVSLLSLKHSLLNQVCLFFFQFQLHQACVYMGLSFVFGWALAQHLSTKNKKGNINVCLEILYIYFLLFSFKESIN